MWKQTYDLTPGSKVVIDQTVGRVTVVGWDQPHVEVVATGDQVERFLAVSAGERKLQLEVDRPSFSLFSTKVPRIDLELKVPSGLRLVIDVGAGDVEVDSLQARSLLIDNGVGQVRCRLARIYPGGKYKVDAGAGDVRMTVPADAGLDVLIDAGLGKVDSAIPLRSNRGRLNRGGATLALDVGVGAVELMLGELQGERLPESPHDEETARILQMVAEGKLSAVEAEAILLALEEDPEERSA